MRQLSPQAALLVWASLPVFCQAPVRTAATGTEPPKSWLDADTGHRVVRLSDEPGSASLYFNQNGYTPDGKDLIYTTPGGISVLNLETHQAKRVVEGHVRVIEAGKKNRTVYYVKDGAVYSVNIDSMESREIGKLPPRGSVATVNADETLIAGTYIEGEGQDYGGPPAQAAQGQGHALEQPRNKGQMMEERLAAHLPLRLFLMNTETGSTRTILRSTDW